MNSTILLFLTLGTMLILVIIGMLSVKYENYYLCILVIVSSVLVGLVTSIISIAIKDREHPQAIDVYRGKTTLKITYQDSIPVDTVVIFKHYGKDI